MPRVHVVDAVVGEEVKVLGGAVRVHQPVFQCSELVGVAWERRACQRGQARWLREGDACRVACCQRGPRWCDSCRGCAGFLPKGVLRRPHMNSLWDCSHSPELSSQLSIASSTSRTKWACPSPNRVSGEMVFRRRFDAAGALRSAKATQEGHGDWRRRVGSTQGTRLGALDTTV